MSSTYKKRYGLSSEEVRIMWNKFRKIKNSGATDWKDLDEFCKWSVQEGYKPGMRIKKQYSFLPHSKENSYYVNTGEPEADRHATHIDAESPFCQNCEIKDCATVSFGCKKWREYFVKNWNDNICRRGRPVPRPADMVFRYEHPDLVREGIVFEHS